mgnify:CR=1 FL=1
MKLSREDLLGIYLTMQRIRKFEKQTQKGFAKGKLPGFVHLSIGQEAIPAGVSFNLKKDDYITSTHRGHGHLIAKGANMKLMMAENYGKETGYCKGKGGSMHIADTEIGILGTNGIVGGGLNLACGAAFSIKQKGEDKVCVCYFGDGASGEGAFHEALNIASIHKLPVVFICENNLYAISCRQTDGMNIENIADRAAGYGIPGEVVDGNDVLAVQEASANAIKNAKNGNGPTLLECKTYRWRGHFEGEPENYRDKEEIKAWKEKDPIKRIERYLLEKKITTEEELKKIQESAKEEAEEAAKFAEDSPWPDVKTVVKDVYTDIVEEAR